MRTTERIRCRILKGNDQVLDSLAEEQGIGISDFIDLLAHNDFIFVDANILNYFKLEGIESPLIKNGYFPKIVKKNFSNTIPFSVYVKRGTIQLLLLKASQLGLNDRGAIGLFIDKICCHPLIFCWQTKTKGLKRPKSKLKVKKNDKL